MVFVTSVNTYMKNCLDLVFFTLVQRSEIPLTFSKKMAHIAALPFELYFERQIASRCGIHALNNATGGQNFLAEHMDNALSAVLSEYACAAAAAGAPCYALPEHHASCSGDYSEEVLGAALRADGRWTADFVSLSACGFNVSELANPTVAGGLVHTSGHWSAVRVIDGQLWVLDSMAPCPQNLGFTDGHVAAAWERDHRRIFPIRITRMQLPCGNLGHVRRAAFPDASYPVRPAPTEPALPGCEQTSVSLPSQTSRTRKRLRSWKSRHVYSSEGLEVAAEVGDGGRSIPSAQPDSPTQPTATALVSLSVPSGDSTAFDPASLAGALASDVNLVAQQVPFGEQREDQPGWVPKDLDSHSTFNNHVDSLLQCFSDKQNCSDFLFSLPSVDPQLQEMNSSAMLRQMQRTLLSLCDSTVNSSAATRVAVPYWRCSLYQLAVICWSHG